MYYQGLRQCVLHKPVMMKTKKERNKNILVHENYEDESFVNEEEEDEQQQYDHEDEYENDSFIIEDNGGTTDGDLTSPSPSFMSGEGDQTQEEVSS